MFSKWFKRKLLNGEMPHPYYGLKDECVINGKAIEIRRAPIVPKHVCPGDEFHLTIEDDSIPFKQTRVFPVETTMLANECFTFVLEDELGYKTALVGGFGERK